MHTRHTAHAIGALAETKERRQEACSCAGILDEELKRLRGACRHWEFFRRIREP